MPCVAWRIYHPRKGIEMFEIQLIGNLGKDPEARYTNEGVLVVNFPVAITTRKDETEWVEVTAWRELGERRSARRDGPERRAHDQQFRQGGYENTN